MKNVVDPTLAKFSAQRKHAEEMALELQGWFWELACRAHKLQEETQVITVVCHVPYVLYLTTCKSLQDVA